jgi:hypothetical protein
MWVQSNWFVGAAVDSNWNYCFSLRPLTVTKYETSTPANGAGSLNLAKVDGSVPIDKTSHYGHSYYLNDGETTSEDSWDGSQKDLDRWGYTWPVEYNINRVVYTTGAQFPDGGWFASNLVVQVRKGFQWENVRGLSINPLYPYDDTAVPTKLFTFTFDDTVGDGIQIIGVPGGTSFFTSIGELEVYYDA